MFWFKACPRCRGDLHEERDIHGPYIYCIQCGYSLSTLEEERLRTVGKLDVEQESVGARPAEKAA